MNEIPLRLHNAVCFIQLSYYLCTSYKVYIVFRGKTRNVDLLAYLKTNFFPYYLKYSKLFNIAPYTPPPIDKLGNYVHSRKLWKENTRQKNTHDMHLWEYLWIVFFCQRGRVATKWNSISVQNQSHLDFWWRLLLVRAHYPSKRLQYRHYVFPIWWPNVWTQVRFLDLPRTGSKHCANARLRRP